MRILTLSCVILVVFLSAPVLFSQNFIEDQISFSNGEVSHQINTWVQGNLIGNLGWFTWTLNSQYWSEAYPGLTYAPFTWCQFGAGYGIETADDPNRYGSFLWIGKGRYSFIGFYEKGGSGYWHRMIGNVSLGKLGVGVINETICGVGRRTGPRAEFSYRKVRLWGTYMDKNYTMLGVNYLF